MMWFSRMILCGCALACGLASTSAAWADAVTVTVLDVDGTPVAGAQVRVRQTRDGAPKTFAAAADARGVARFDLARSDDSEGRAKAYYGNVVVHAPGRGLVGAALTESDNVVRLLQSRTLRGRVIDAEGAPVESARVEMADLYSRVVRTGDAGYLEVPREGLQVVSEYTAISDADGAWEIPNVPRDFRASVRLLDDQYADARFEEEREGEPVTVRTSPPSTLEGRVVDDEGKPLASYLVAASFAGSTAIARTDAGGVYRLTRLLGGSGGHLVFNVADESEFFADMLVNVQIAEGTTTRLPDTVATRGVLVEGIVRDAASGEPVAGAVMSAEMGKPSRHVYMKSRTGADGSYSVRVLPGDVTLKASLPMAGVPLQEQPSASQRFEARAGSPVRQDLVLQPPL